MGVTTRSGLLTAPLRDRFGINLHSEYYDVETLTDIVLRSARIPEVPCEEEAVGALRYVVVARLVSPMHS